MDSICIIGCTATAGGDGYNLFSTTAGIVAAGAGARVIKHGSRASASSADLQALDCLFVGHPCPSRACPSPSSSRPTTIPPSPPLCHRLIKASYSLAVAQNVLTTALTAFRTSRTSSESAKSYEREKTLLPILRVLMESALQLVVEALQLVVEALSLVLYAGGLNAVLLPQGVVTPVVLRRAVNTTTTTTTTTHMEVDPVQTIGSMPKKRITVDTVTEIDIDVRRRESSPPTPSGSSREAAA
ncbi:anthranilate phosphoribosyltransferase [Pleurotus pulmonarius]|nr:anthranilate phosphoribosyltransferase [Pleurotus pulmonarius]